MNPIDDRVVFFLEHEKQIREWAALEKECRVVVQDFLVGLEDDLVDLAETLGGHVEVWSNVKPAIPSEGLILLHQSGWYEHSGGIRAGIGLGWSRGSVTFAGPSRPYTGIHVNLGVEHGQALHDEIKSRLLLNGVVKGTRYQLGKPWAAWRYEAAPSDEYWRDLLPYRKNLVAVVRSAWEAMSGHVDAAVGGLG